MKVTSAVIVLAVLGGTAGSGFQQSPKEWEVTGKVTNDSGPIRGATVMFSGPKFVPSVKTDGAGSYTQKGVTPGRYVVSVMKMDNENVPAPRTFNLASGARLDVSFRIPRGAILSGRVLDENRQPVPGMIVRALAKSLAGNEFNLTEQGYDLTNDLGAYRLRHLPDGAYAIAVGPKEPLPIGKPSPRKGAAGKGYPAITFFPGASLTEGATVVEVRSGDEQTGLDIVLRKQPTLCVSFSVGQAWQRRARIQLAERVNGYQRVLAQGAAVTTSREVCGLTPGDYGLQLGDYGVDKNNRFQVFDYQMVLFSVGKENVDLGAVEPLGRADIPGTVVIKGDGGNSVPAGLRVHAVASDTAQRMYSGMPVDPVKADGTFILSRLFQGNYRAYWTGLPAPYYVIDATQRGRSVLNGGLQPGDGDLKVTLGADGAALSGRVQSADGAALPDVAVLLVPQASGMHLVAYSDQSGAYQFAGLRPGTYRAAAVSDILAWQTRDAGIAARLAASGREIELGSSASRAMDLKVQSVR